jgi:hypothetical protein
LIYKDSSGRKAVKAGSELYKKIFSSSDHSKLIKLATRYGMSKPELYTDEQIVYFIGVRAGFIKE